eukprot:GILK01004126.1.p1 GENE.GILK01004126.1~~GILK01004126.1.p1  ORF type:complete len:1188 (+),score=258.47 GILK01004126.1:46-3609(+)
MSDRTAVMRSLCEREEDEEQTVFCGHHGTTVTARMSRAVATVSPAEDATVITMPQRFLASQQNGVSVEDVTVAAAHAHRNQELKEEAPLQSSEWEVGSTVDNVYEVVRVLGRGGMGTVHEVYHKIWRKSFAVKTPILQNVSRSDMQTFLQECESWVNLGMHPNIVAAYLVTELAGMPRIFAEIIRDQDLTHWVKTGRMYEGTPSDVTKRILGCAIDMAWGLAYAHSQNLVHQDMKPDNVMVSCQTGSPVFKITDFGLVTRLSNRTQLKPHEHVWTLLSGPPSLPPSQLVCQHCNLKVEDLCYACEACWQSLTCSNCFQRLGLVAKNETPHNPSRFHIHRLIPLPLLPAPSDPRTAKKRIQCNFCSNSTVRKPSSTGGCFSRSTAKNHWMACKICFDQDYEFAVCVRCNGTMEKHLMGHKHPLVYQLQPLHDESYVCKLCGQNDNGRYYHCDFDGCDFDACPLCYADTPMQALEADEAAAGQLDPYWPYPVATTSEYADTEDREMQVACEKILDEELESANPFVGSAPDIRLFWQGGYESDDDLLPASREAIQQIERMRELRPEIKNKRPKAPLVGGTPSYWSPEQCDAFEALNRAASEDEYKQVADRLQPLTDRVDMYSYGLTLLYVLLGKKAWRNGAACEDVATLLKTPSAIERDPRIPVIEPLNQLVLECLQRDPVQRPFSMQTLSNRLLDIYKEVCGIEFSRRQPCKAKDEPYSLNNKALSLLELGKQRAALRCWRKALKTEPTHFQSLFNFNAARFSNGRRNEVDVTQRLQRLEDGNEKTFALGCLYAKIGDLKKCAEHLNSMLESQPAAFTRVDSSLMRGTESSSGLAVQAARLLNEVEDVESALESCPIRLMNKPGVIKGNCIWVRITHDMRHIVVVTDKNIEVYTPTVELVHRWPLQKMWFNATMIAPGDKWFVGNNQDTHIACVHLFSGKVGVNEKFPHRIMQMKLLHDESIAIQGQNDRLTVIRLIDNGADIVSIEYVRTVTLELGVSAPVSQCVISAMGDLIAIGFWKGFGASLIKCETGALVQRFEVEKRPHEDLDQCVYEMALTDNGSRLFLAFKCWRCVRMYDVATGLPLAHCLIYDPLSGESTFKQLIVANNDHTLIVRDASTICFLDTRNMRCYKKLNLAKGNTIMELTQDERFVVTVHNGSLVTWSTNLHIPHNLDRWFEPSMIAQIPAEH